jgi:hypothetical protein
MSKIFSGVTNVRQFPWSFFAVSFGITWSVWIPFAVMSQIWGIPPSLLLNIGAFGPSVAGILMIYRNPDVRVHLDFWRRLISFRSITIGGYLFIFGVIPALYFLAALVDCIVHNVPLSFLTTPGL